MKRTVFRSALALLASLTVAAATSETDWKKVYEARDKGLPKTGIEELNPIIAEALQNKRYAEAIKAIGMKVAFEGNIEGNKAEEKVTRLQDEIEKAPAEMKPIMEAVLANWYWHYFQQNRWRFQQRTQTAEPPAADFTTWDLPRILAEIDKHFTAALAGDEILKAARIEDYNDLLEKGTVPDTYRPTVFDFLAHEALAFYQAGEQGVAKAEDAFEIAADSPVFGTADEFLKWQPETTDAASPKLKAIKLFQKLLTFHRDDADQSAFIDADLWRLTFGKNQAVGPDLDDNYKAALKRFSEGWADHEISARALHAWAGVLQSENELVEAHKLARRGADAHPDSIGGAMCHNLIKQIEARNIQITSERVWNEPWPTITIEYKNLTNVYFRAVSYDFGKFVARQRWGFRSSLHGLDWKERDKFIAELIDRKPDSEWNHALPSTSDYRNRTEKVAAAKDLKPGFYFILVGHDPSFGKDDNRVSVAPVWISDLALVVRQHDQEAVLDGFILKALSGEPVAGAEVLAWTENREGKLVKGPSAKTDANGMFRFAGETGNYLLLAESGGHSVASVNQAYMRDRDSDSPDHATVFFTDRALYRPGQAIYYKGIHYRYNRNENIYGTIAGEDIIVEFRDPNGKEIARAVHKSNDYGAFNGVFTAPRDRVMGQMTISHPHKGSTSLNVEEYKRPKFRVELAPPKEAGKLGAEIAVPGKATAYTGAAIGGARIKWRVERNVQFPYWCWWGWYCLPPNRGASQNIAHGTATSGPDGSFDVKFSALPDLSVPEKTEPTFTFTVYADVTDSTGETRSGSQSVRLGYTAMAATIGADAWQTPEKPVEWSVGTTSLDGEPQAAEGTLKVYALKQPEKIARPELAANNPYDYWWFRRNAGKDMEPKADPANPESWELAGVVADETFKTDEKGQAKIATPLKAGIYRAMLETKDRFGKKVTARRTIHVVDVKGTRFPVKLPHYFAAPKWSVEPGERFLALWGTGYSTGRAFVELEHRGKLLRAFWTGEDRTQDVIEQSVSEDMRGGFTIRITYIRENRAYLENRVVDVPWSNKKLSVKWEHFTSKLEPGRKETWTAIVSGPDARQAVAEMVATLYDASLDQFKQHAWMQAFNMFRRESNRVQPQFENSAAGFEHILGNWKTDYRSASLTYRHYPDDLSANLWMWGYFGDRVRRGKADQSILCKMSAAGGAEGEALDRLSSAPACAAPEPMDLRADAQKKERSSGWAAASGPSEPEAAPDLDKVAARKNLNETAFFFPHLVSGEDGTVRMEFTMPEALTEWTFMGFAHDRDLRSGFIQDKAVTAKDLMVEPNPPRFVREGDAIEFTVKVSNQSVSNQSGTVRLTFADAKTLKDVSQYIGLKATDQVFDIRSKESKTFSWRIEIPDGCDFLTYKAVGASGSFSDGEEGYLPVLSRRIEVIESLPLPIRGAQTRNFEFTKLLESGKSKTLRHENLTVQMVSRPAWYAVMALPYLMEYPHECSEQVFNRLYANLLAQHIANSDPGIRNVFDQWKNTPALDSPMEKNQDLKSVMIEETPWLRQAQDESQARRNVGVLFDANRIKDETSRAFSKLEQMQLGNGLWPWFPGFRGDEYITLYITTGFGRLRHLGAKDVDMSAAIKALGALDTWMDDRYRYILKHGDKDRNHLDSTIAFYLYGRSFFLEDKAVAKEHQEALKYWLGQASNYWLDLGWRQSQGHLAIGLKRFGDEKTPLDIMKSIKERSVSNEELGLFWRDQELSWWWYRAPIETQALMIEAFDEVMGDTQAMEDAKVWLLKQKQTQDWKTTRATADAIYGLLLRGTNLLAGDALVEVRLGGEAINPEKVEAGTGFYEQKFVRGEIKPEMGMITVIKTDGGVSWGSVHWQYLEDMTKVTPYEGTPMKLKKALYRKDSTKKGQVLEPVKGSLAVGDELVCRIELRVDRDMEYVHLKDQRGSGTEPVNVLSQCKYQDGLSYYESTRDTATHFFIHYLPKGVYVFEYSVRVQLKGSYQSGIASIQCMYAPEFNSHSESIEMEVK